MYVEDQKILPKSFPFAIQRYTEKRVSRGEHLASHWHNFIEITYVETGSLQYITDRQIYHVEAGDVILFNHLESHCWKVNSAACQLLVLTFSSRIISDSMNAMDMDYLIPFLSQGSNFQNRLKRTDEHVAGIYRMMEEILKEDKEQLPGYQLMIKADIMRLLTILVRYYQRTDGVGSELAETKQGMKRMAEALVYIKERFTQKLTLEEVAECVCLSPNYFSGCFRKATGYCFQEYVSKLRMERARELLKESDQDILTIALECGVSNLANFYRQYKKYYGSTPGEIRQKMA